MCSLILLLPLLHQLPTPFIKPYTTFTPNTLLHQLLTHLLSPYTISFISDFFDKSIAMPSRRDPNKNRQTIIKSENSNNNEENDEETNEEIVFIANFISHNNSLLMILISNFSQKQVTNLIIMISTMINARLEQRFENFNINRQQNNFFSNIEAFQSYQKQHSFYIFYKQFHISTL